MQVDVRKLLALNVEDHPDLGPRSKLKKACASPTLPPTTHPTVLSLPYSSPCLSPCSAPDHLLPCPLPPPPQNPCLSVTRAFL